MKKILWLIDSEGWAYEARVDACIKAMPEYIHVKFYMNHMQTGILKDMTKTFDIVVCMFVQYSTLLDDLKNVVINVGGMRPFEGIKS